MLCKIDSKEIVEKEFILNNEPKRLKMTAPAAIYMLLKEYNVAFNEEMFKDTYKIENIDDVF